MSEVIVAYLHYLAVLITVAALLAELLHCHQDMQPPDIRKLVRIDLVYFIAAMAALATGLARVFLVGKGWSFYSHNPVFYIKVALFVAVGLISVPPTLQFQRWMKALRAGEGRVLTSEQIAATRNFLLAEAALLLLIPLLAVLMARGIGTQPVAS